jgi:hypothetical protein
MMESAGMMGSAGFEPRIADSLLPRGFRQALQRLREAGT